MDRTKEELGGLVQLCVRRRELAIAFQGVALAATRQAESYSRAGDEALKDALSGAEEEGRKTHYSRLDQFADAHWEKSLSALLAARAALRSEEEAYAALRGGEIEATCEP